MDAIQFLQGAAVPSPSPTAVPIPWVTPPPVEETVLGLTTDGGAVHLPSGSVVSLKTRRALASILLELVRAHLDKPGDVVSAHTLIRTAWPNERLVGDSGMNRLRVAMNTLRGFGLREILRTGGGGYAIGTDVRIAWLNT